MSQGGRQRAGHREAEGTPAAPKADKPQAQTREQHRAKLAWQWVQEARKNDFGERYGTLARKLPNYLQTSGFEQTMAFLFAKTNREETEKKAEGLLFLQMARHTLSPFRRAGMPIVEGNAPISQLMRAVVELTADESRRASHEAMRIAEWLRRFAPAELGVEKE